MTARSPGLHSRSVLAGYDPDLLQAGRVLVAGLGALGQNLVQNLALLGVGHLLLVDFDEFEGHNATRSPFFPTAAEVARLGRGKAVIVAHRVAQAATANPALVYYSARPVQVLGDGAVAWADVVVSAVDNMNARAWLSERCRLLGRPMVEGGFAGPDFNLSAFAATAGAVCYRCGRPDRESAMSCTAYARAAEDARIVPAIQTSAAVLGGYQAELVVQLLHGRLDRLGKRSYGNVRTETLRTVSLPVDEENCPGCHEPEPRLGTVVGLGPSAALSDLLAAVAAQFGGGSVELAEPVVSGLGCTGCRNPCAVLASESAWLACPRCHECGGPWPRAAAGGQDAGGQDMVRVAHTSDRLSAELAAVPLDRIGLRAGAALAVTLDDGRSGILTLAGDILAHVDRPVLADTAPAGTRLGAMSES